MAEDNREVLIKINIDEGTYKKKIVSLQQDIVRTKKEEQELAKAIKLAGEATEEQATQQVELKARLKELNTEQRVAVATLESKAKADKAALGSIDQMRAQLSLLTRQWNELSEEERENTELGKQLGKQTKELSDKLKEQEKVVGDTRRNVGNYAGGILEAVDGTGLLATITAKATQAQQAYTATLNLTKASLAGNISMLKAFKLAMAATGIGAVVLLLGGLVSWLTRTQEGLDFVSQKTKGITTVIGALTDRLSAVGKATIDWFAGIEDLGDLLTKLGDVILENLTNRIKGFAVILEALQTRDFSKLQDGITQVATGITDATAKTKAFAAEMNEVRKSAEAVEKEYQRIRDAEIALTAEREKANVIIEQNKKIADDTTKSQAERVAAAQKANEELTRITEKELELQRAKVANIELEQSLTNNLTEDNQKLAEEKAKLYKVEAQNTTRSIELQNKLNSINKEAQAKALEATKKQIAAEAELLDIRSKSSLNSEEDVLELQLQIIEKKKEAELLAENLTQSEILVIKERALQEEEALSAEYREERRKREIEEAEFMNKAAYQVSEKMLEAGFERQNLILKQQRAQGLLTEEEYQLELDSMRVKRLQAELIALQKFEGKVVGIDEKIAEKRLEISSLLAEKQIDNINKVEQREEERQQAMMDRQAQNLQLMGEVMSTLAIQLGEALVTQGNALEQFSANVILLAVDTISTIMQAQVAGSIGAASVQAMASPESIATAGVAGVAKALALVALIRGFAAAAKAGITQSISKGTPDVFAAGGYTGDGEGKPDHTGFKIAGVVHEDEWVAPKWMTNSPVYAGMIEELEMIRQRGYATGGYVAPANAPYLPTFKQPVTTVQYLSGASAAAIDYEKLGEAVGRNVPKYIKTSDVKNALVKELKTAAMSNQ